MSRVLALVVLLILPLGAAGAAQVPSGQPAPTASPAASADAADPFLWLEDVNGTRSLAWVKAENAKTLSVLQGDPRFAGFYATARTIGEAKDRIPYPQLINGRVYNFWQDARHVRGIWRTAPLAGFTSSAPAWKTRTGSGPAPTASRPAGGAA